MIVGWQVKLAFYPKQANPARAGGRGVYRVVASYPCKTVRPRIQCYLATDRPGRYLYLNAPREYKRGSRVDPRRVLGI